MSTAHSGVFTVNGDVAGTDVPAQAIVTVFQAAGVQTFPVAVAVGTPPPLPATVRVVYDDGVGQDLPVTWDAVDPSAYASPGTFTVHGTVAGVSLPATATIRGHATRSC